MGSRCRALSDPWQFTVGRHAPEYRRSACVARINFLSMHSKDVMGLGGSMLWWDERLCRMLAGDGRFVIRYDHRDTGRSVTYDLDTDRTTALTWSPTSRV